MAFRANGFADSDLPRSLGDGNQHDIHDADSAHEQRYADNAAHDQRCGPDDRVQRRCQLLGSLNSKIVLLHQGPDFVSCAADAE